jgi:hypothetical protein
MVMGVRGAWHLCSDGWGGAAAPPSPASEVSGLVIASSHYGLRQERRSVLDVGEAYWWSLLGR